MTLPELDSLEKLGIGVLLLTLIIWVTVLIQVFGIN